MYPLVIPRSSQLIIQLRAFHPAYQLALLVEILQLLLSLPLFNVLETLFIFTCYDFHLFA